MRIHPPKLEIPDTNPFSVDLFRNRKKFGDTLTNLLRKLDEDENLVVLVDAPWGGGKSTFISMWEKALKNPPEQNGAPGKPVHLIRFDAFFADHHEDPFVAFSGEVIEFIREKKSESFTGTAKDFGKKAARFGSKLIKPVLRGAIKAGTAGIIDCVAIGDALSESSDVVADALQKRIEQYGEDRNSLVEFKASLAQVAAKVREEQDFPLVIVVDELDRCRPDFALKLLERIKHLFDVPGVAFVLFAHKAQLEEMIRHTYGRDVDANAYLHKFVHMATHLLDNGKNTLRHSDAAIYGERLSRHYGLFEENGDSTLPRYFAAFIHFFELSLREAERTCSILSVYSSMYLISGHTPARDIITLLLAVLKVRRPDLYSLISKKGAAYDTIRNALRLGDNESKVIFESCDPNWLSDILFLGLGSNSSQVFTLNNPQAAHSFHSESPTRVVTDIVRKLDSLEVM